MANIVLCSKEKGNTAKLCDAISAIDGWERALLNGTETPDLSGYETVIIGTGVYGGFPHKNLMSYLRDVSPESAPKKINVLITWLGRGKSDRAAYERIREECAHKGISVATEYHACLANSFGVFHIGRPNKQDIESCVRWAKTR